MVPKGMSGRSALSLAVMLTACASAGPLGGQTLPADVVTFVERREACDHFRNEEPYDAGRAGELKISLAKTCTGTDKELRALRRKYAGNRRVIDRLSGYEERVE